MGNPEGLSQRENASNTPNWARNTFTCCFCLDKTNTWYKGTAFPARSLTEVWFVHTFFFPGVLQGSQSALRASVPLICSTTRRFPRELWTLCRDPQLGFLLLLRRALRSAVSKRVESCCVVVLEASAAQAAFQRLDALALCAISNFTLHRNRSGTLGEPR